MNRLNGALIRQGGRQRMALILAAEFGMILAGMVLSVSLGAASIGPADIAGGVFGRVKTGTSQLIIWDSRLPRAVCALLVGGFLAASGAILQGLTRNPIASPSIMGVNQGAVLAMAIYMTIREVPALPGRVFFAFAGASVSAVLVFLLSTKRAGLDITRLLLAGTALGMLFSSLAAMIAILTNNSKNLAFWMAGGLGGSTWGMVRVLLIAAAALVFALILSPRITILSLGDDVAVGLGEQPNRVRFGGLLCVVLLSGAAAAVGGNIGFVCLIVPQIVRLGVGSDYRRVIPFSIVTGAVLMLYSDILARTLNSPFEIPVGSLTSLLGVPVLIGMIKKERRI
ncbi:MAG: iron ABC transporter permease [Spirochaetaceae bacterium]|jgi:iron complex transport system permease protein|nr:iron ABC transporter permease [Spirochaetaceae bacterium]